MEAQECLIQNRWLDLASLILASADVIFSKASEKGKKFNSNICFI